MRGEKTVGEGKGKTDWTLPTRSKTGLAVPARYPHTMRPAWPTTVGSGNPGMSAYGICVTGFAASRWFAMPPRPEPQTIATLGLGPGRQFVMYCAAECSVSISSWGLECGAIVEKKFV